MKKIIIMIITLLLSLMIVNSASQLTKPDIKNDLTKEEKNSLTQQFNTDKYEIISDWTTDNDYCFKFKPINKIKCITNYQEKLIVYKTVGIPGGGVKKEVVQTLTLEELREQEIIKILKTYTAKKESIDAGSKGYEKRWN